MGESEFPWRWRFCRHSFFLISFFLYSLCLSSSHITSLSSSAVSIYVTSVVDTYPNITLCNPSTRSYSSSFFYSSSSLSLSQDHTSSSYGCNLRSAIEYCKSNTTVLKNICQIILPTETIIPINSSYGIILLHNITGKMIIYGNNSTILSTSPPPPPPPTGSTSNNSRFLDIFINKQIYQFSLNLYDLILQNFGNYYNETGGALHLVGLSHSIFENIIFLSNFGYSGGSLYLQSCQYIVLQYCQWNNNIGRQSGGAMTLNSENSHITFHHNIFQSNYILLSIGGAIEILSNNYNITFIDTIFYNNTAVRNGGGVYLLHDNHEITFMNSSFISNSLDKNKNSIDSSSGGGIYIDRYNENITISYCLFIANDAVNGGGISMNTGNRVLVSDTQFYSHNITSYGGGIYLNTDNTITITRSNFMNNSCISGCAIYSNSGNTLAHIEQLQIMNNRGYTGGSIYLLQFHYSITFSNILFSNNYVMSSAIRGSAGIDIGDYSYYITLMNCTFDKNIGYDHGGGFSINTYSGEINFINCQFYHNLAYYGSAGFVALQVSNILFENCLFSSGYSYLGGIIMFYFINIDIIFKNCLFSNNFAYNGGVITWYSQCFFLKILSCHFVNNTASNHGGVIYLYEGNDLDIIDSYFHTNHAINGGAIYLSQHNILTITTTTFQENTATTSGGSIFLLNDNDQFLVKNSYFMRNYALINGGSIFITDSNHEIQILHSHFVMNDSDRGGGGAISIQSNNLELLIYNTSFIQNKALLTGGAIYSALGNSEISIELSTFHLNIATYGGGIYLGDYHNPISIQTSIFSSNYAEYGSGLYLTPFNSNIYLNDIQFFNNFALYSAGGIHSYASPLYLQTISFINNIARSSSSGYLNGDIIILMDIQVRNGYSTSDSGGLVIEKVSILNISSSLFENNTGIYGAALLLTSPSSSSTSTTSTSSYILNCSFLDNYASLLGGAITSEYISHLHVINSTFQGNTAGTTGGAISSTTTEYLSIETSQFYNNTALLYGGGLYIENGNFLLRNSSFISNKVIQGYGSTIFLSSSYTLLYENFFHENYAKNGGGTIFWEYWSLMTEPYGLDIEGLNVFENNQVGYGPQYATEGIQLHLTNTNTSSYRINDYQTNLLYLSISLQDYYSQIVTTTIPPSSSSTTTTALTSTTGDTTSASTTSSIIELSSISDYNCDNHNGYLSGGIINEINNGYANFTSLEVYCAPGYSLTVQAQYSSSLVPILNFTLTFRKCLIGEYYNGYSCKLCENGTYSLVSTSNLNEMSQINICKKCPDDVARQCYGNIIHLKSSYWRLSLNTDVIFSCPTGNMGCIGGIEAGDGLCNEGYYGPLCSLCRHGYAYSKSSNTCIKCQNTNGFDEISILFFLFLGIILLGVFLWYYFSTRDTSSTIGTTSIHNFNDFLYFLILKFYPKLLDNKTKIEVIFLIKLFSKRIFARMKVYITLYQILSMLPFVLDMTFPSPISYFIYCWKFISGTISDSTLPACSLHSYDFIDSLLIDTIFPFIIILGIYCIYLIHSRYIIVYKSPSLPSSVLSSTRSSSSSSPSPPPPPPPTGPSSSSSNLQQLQDNYFMIFLFWTYLILPSVSTKIFQTFSCVNLDPTNAEEGEHIYMVADYSISCTSSRYYFGYLWALIMILVYPIGFPCLYFYFLYKYRHEISSRDTSPNTASTTTTLPSPTSPTLSPSSSPSSSCDMSSSSPPLTPPSPPRNIDFIHFLYHTYRPTLWWWEMIETFTRLSLTGFLILIKQGTPLQIVIGLLFSLLFIHLYDYYRPYDDEVIFTIKKISQWQIFFIFFLSLLLKANFSSIHPDFLIISFIFIIFINLLIDLMKFLGFCLKRSHQGTTGGMSPTPPTPPSTSSMTEKKEEDKKNDDDDATSIDNENNEWREARGLRSIDKEAEMVFSPMSYKKESSIDGMA